MRTWEQVIEARGEARGEARCEARGEAKGRRMALRILLEVRFGPVPQRVSSRLEGADVARLDEWIARFGRDDPPEELFEG